MADRHPSLPDDPTDVGNWCGTVWHGDCLEILPRIPDRSVDLILVDLPYGTSRNRWDTPIDLRLLWEQYKRIRKDDTAILFTAAQPFTSILVTSNLEEFRYEWIWRKTIGSGQLNVKHQPLRIHESVLVFYKKRPTYNPQLTEGEPYTVARDTSSWQGRGYGKQRDHRAHNPGVRYPKSVITVPNPRIKGGHPTQKPVALFEYLIRTYTNPGDVVLDNAIGAGTTAVAAERSGRRWIGIEIDERYVELANRNIRRAREGDGAG